MKFVVDASIVVKWFVAEDLSDPARLLLAQRNQFFAPGLLLAEFANTIWKKARRGDIADPQPHLDELSNLSSLISLYPTSALVNRASQISFAIDHPIYDCLYLAAAEATDSPLITADKRLITKVGDQLPDAPVLHIAAPATIRLIANDAAPASS